MLHDSQNKNLEASHNLLLCKQSKESLNHEMNTVLKISVEKDEKIKNLEKEVLRKDDFVSPEFGKNVILQLQSEVEKSKNELKEKTLQYAI